MFAFYAYDVVIAYPLCHSQNSNNTNDIANGTET